MVLNSHPLIQKKLQNGGLKSPTNLHHNWAQFIFGITKLVNITLIVSEALSW